MGKVVLQPGRNHCTHYLQTYTNVGWSIILLTCDPYLVHRVSLFSMYAFSANNNQELQYLWDWNQHNLTIKTGKLFFKGNPKLCMSEIRKMWDKTGIQGRFDETDFHKNGYRASCKSQNGLKSKTHSRLNCYVKLICRCYCSELIPLWAICQYSLLLIFNKANCSPI